MRKEIILTIGAAIALIMFGGAADAQGAAPNVVVTFNIENPDFSIYVELPGPGGESSTDAFVQASLNGTGRAAGIFQGQSNTDTGWANLYGAYVGSEGDFSSTFLAKAVRTNNSPTNSTFVASQSIDATGVGPLQLTDTGQVVSGLYVYGETGACSVADTWALGSSQGFAGTADSLTVTVDRDFEQHNSDGSPHGTPNPTELSVTSTDEDSYAGFTESGSYDGAALGVLQNQPGFGFGSSTLTLDVQKGASWSTTTARISTDQIVGQTSTWYNYPGYTTGP